MSLFAQFEHRSLLPNPTFPAEREWRSSMRQVICALAAFGTIGLASHSAAAADLGGYEEYERYVERPARVIERERIIERHYYQPRYYEEEAVVYYPPRPRVYGYYAAGYPSYDRPRFRYRHHHWRDRDWRW